MMISWWIVVTGVAYFVAKAIMTQKSESAKQDSALEVLKKRYARGEISREEFESKKKDLIRQTERSNKP